MTEPSEWTPLVTDPGERARLAARVAEIAAAVATTTPSTIAELTDHAILGAYVSETPADALERGVDEMSRPQPYGASVFQGITRVGWTVAHLAGGETAEQVCSSLDAALAGALATPWLADYDLIAGLVGIGVYALEREAAGHALAVRVLEQLERLARPRGGGLAWHTAPELLSPSQREHAPDGCWDLGVAHGVGGVVALLARFAVHEVEPERTARLLDAAVAYLLAQSPPAPEGRFPGWTNDAGAAPDAPRSRLAWCYGDLGIAVALYAASEARANSQWRAEALSLARACAGRSFESARIVDGCVCHGAAGAAHLFHRLYRASGDTTLGAAARTWLDRLLAMRTADSNTDSSLLEGTGGIALVLQSMISDVEPRWDRLLLADL